MEFVKKLRLSEALHEMTLGALEGAQLGGEHILRISNGTVPIEEGTLERSGTVTSEIRDGVAVAAIAYDTPYAVVQHENLTYRHDAGREPKYLERAMAKGRGVALKIAAQSVKNRVKGKA